MTRPANRAVVELCPVTGIVTTVVGAPGTGASDATIDVVVVPEVYCGMVPGTVVPGVVGGAVFGGAVVGAGPSTQKTFVFS